jgi:putative acetyltransferase
MHIRETLDSELNEVLRVESQAFGYVKEAELVRGLLSDPSAKPVLSLLAFEKEQAVGHILFTKVGLEGSQRILSLSILAPLAVVPDAQKQGVGGKLIEKGLELLSKSGVDMVFVHGHPGYYPRYGFEPAWRYGLEAPYPIPQQYKDAWMVMALKPDVLGTIKGKVICSDELNKPEHWRE